VTNKKIEYDYGPVPTIERFTDSTKFIRGIMGPFGSGKSSGCVLEIIRRGMEQRPGADGIRRTRWAVIRNSYPQLNDSTIRTVHDWFPPRIFGKYHTQKHEYKITRFKDCEIEILFRALDRPDQVENLLSTEYTGAWLNEAREVPEAIFEAIQGRVGRYPSFREEGCTWDGVIMDTNPPDTDSWWYRHFEESLDTSRVCTEIIEDSTGKKCGEPSVRVFNKFTHEEFAFCRKHDKYELFKQPSGLSPKAENLVNLKKDYYKNLAAGKKSEYIKVYIHGDYGFIIDGQPVYPEYDDAVHCGEFDVTEGLMIRRGWDFGLCYSDDTEVLTKSGWKLFKDVDEVFDQVATRNPDTGLMEYTDINFKVDRPYRGEMLEWANTEMNMCVTPEHVVPFTYRDTPDKVHWASAQWLSENMSGHHYVDLCSQWSPDYREKEYFGISSKVFAGFMGIYLSEGCTDGNRVSIYQKENNREIADLLRETGKDWRRKDGGKAAGWRLYDPELALFLNAFGRACIKYVHPIIKQMPTSHILNFIRFYTIGDGHIRVRNGVEEHTIFTTSLTMAGALQELAQKVGWNTSLRVVAPQQSVMAEGNTARVITNKGGYSITFKKHAQRAEFHKRSFRRVQYDGRIYCLNVPYHTLYVRRGGKPHWNGNTPAVTFSQMHPSGQWRILDEFVGTNIAVDRFSDDLITYCNQHYPDFIFQDFGDPAGDARSQVDEKTCFQILRSKGIMIEPGTQEPGIRIEAVRKPMGRKDGFVMHPRCKVLRKGFKGGYFYRKMMNKAGTISEKPEKNDYSHPHDALQYDATRLFAYDLLTPKKEAARQRYDDKPKTRRRSWMAA